MKVATSIDHGVICNEGGFHQAARQKLVYEFKPKNDIKDGKAMKFQPLVLLLAIGSFLGLVIGFETGASNYLTNSLVLIFIVCIFWFIAIRIFKNE